MLLGPFFARLAVPSVSVLSSNGVSCTAMSIRNVHHYVYTRAALRRRHVEHFPATHFIFARHCLLCDELDTDAPNSGDDGFRRPTLRLPVLPTRSPATTRHRPLPSPRAPVVTTVTTVTGDDSASTAAIAASTGRHHGHHGHRRRPGIDRCHRRQPRSSPLRVQRPARTILDQSADSLLSGLQVTKIT